MAKGKKTSPEDIYKVMVSWAMTQSFAETARELKMPETTVEKIVKDNKGKKEFVELCAENKEWFKDSAERILRKSTTLLERKLDRALYDESTLDLLISEICKTGEDADGGMMSKEHKNALIKMLDGMTLYDIKALSTVIGTTFDKKSLIEGKPTANVSFTDAEVLDKLASLAGYKRNDK